jgi:RHS repeat-associated protein
MALIFMLFHLNGANMKRLPTFLRRPSNHSLSALDSYHYVPARLIISLILTFALLAPTLTLAGPTVSRRPSGRTESGFLAFAAETLAAGLRTIFRQGGDAARGMPPKQPLPQKVEPPRPLSKGEREAKVARLEANVGDDLTLEAGQQVQLMAVPYDANGDAIHGLNAEWESENPEVASITKSGEATALSAGKAVLRASAGQKKIKIKLLVIPSPPKQGGNNETSSISHRPSRRELANPVSQALRAQGRASQLAQAIMQAHARRWSPSPAPFDQLPTSETGSIYNAGNAVGAPPGKTTPGAPVPAAATDGTEMPGSANFNFEVPIISLPGRGLDAALSLVYNSRLWNKSTSSNQTYLTYDVDSGWPAPGFRLGYGQLVGRGDSTFTLIDPDGTRHSIDFTGTGYGTTDGTFIQYMYDGHVTRLIYPDGTQVKYGAANGSISYPTQITDRNGNFITIAYAGTNGAGPRIASVQDTLGRHINFFYDTTTTTKDLVAITAPGLGNNADRQMIRFYYTDHVFPTAGLFQTGVNVRRPSSAHVISDVYLASSADSASTQTSYHYEYSSYGMIRQVTKYAGRTVSSPDDLAHSGTINPNTGTWVAQTTYSYPASASNLSDAPTFQTRTDDWQGRTSALPVYTFEVDQANGISKVTSPDGTIMETRSIVDTGQWDDGLLKSTTVEKMVNNVAVVLASRSLNWEQDSSGQNPRINRIETTNDNHQRQSVVLSYTSYNNVFVREEYGFVPDTSPPGTLGTKLRSTGYTYVADTQYTAQGLVHLLASETVISGDGNTVASHIYYYYDEYTNSAVGPLMMRTLTDTHDASYDAAMTVRGNLTSILNLRDPYNYSTFVKTYSSYDVLGNVVAETVNCCRRKVISYSYSDTLPDYYKYAYPVSVSRGDAGQLTTSATYDLNTGVVNNTTDENNQITSFYYRSKSLRPWEIDYPGGGRTNYNYGDWPLFNDPDAAHANTYVNVTTWLDTGSNPQRYTDSYQFMDGRGSVVRTFGNYTAQNGWVARDIEYDVLGRVKRSSNPYYNNGATGPLTPDASPLWTSNAYDNLNRLTSVTMPGGDDAAHAQGRTTLINTLGNVTTVTDAAGRQRRQTLDELGRLKQVDEQDPQALTLTQSTGYEYDTLGNLTHVTQGAQERVFKYDAMGHLTYEKQPEQAAPYTDPYDASKHWSAYYVYDNNELLNDSYDARQVHTHFDYDGLNRPWHITYTGESAPVQTPQLTYSYDEARNAANGQPYANRGRVTTVTTAAVDASTGRTPLPQTKQELNYDAAGRVVSQKETVGSNTYSLSYGYNQAGELTSEQYPSGRTVSYTFDEAGRLSTASDQTHSFITAVGYADHGAVSSLSLGNGAMQSIQYNLALQPLSVSLSKSGAVLSRLDYKYGVVNQGSGAVEETKNTGQVGRIEGFIGTGRQWQQRLSYDSVGRLTQSAEYRGDTLALSYQASYTYDPYGNRAQPAVQNPPATTLAYPPVELSDYNSASNRYTSGIVYDSAGNITDDGRFAGSASRHALYRYDANGRQVWSGYSDNTGSLSAVYDGLGQRVQSSAGTVTKTLVYDIFGQKVAEYGGQTTQQTSGVRYQMMDHQGSLRVLMNESGGVLARHDYTAYGEEIGVGTGLRTGVQGYGNPNSSMVDDTREKYAGMERDENGLDHTSWRKYESVNGRWSSPDPFKGSMSLGDPQSFNRYSYVQNDPVNLVDASGLDAVAPGSGGQCTEFDANGACIVRNTDPFTLTGAAAALALWNPISRIGVDPRSAGGDDPLQTLKQGHAFGDADTVLLFDKQCRDFLTKGRSLNEVREILGKFGRTAAYDSKLEARAVTANSGQGSDARITLSAHFFSNDSSRMGYYYNSTAGRYEHMDYGLTPRQFRALTILHELAHALGIIPRDGRAFDPTGKQSEKNDDTINDKCGTGLGKLPSND